MIRRFVAYFCQCLFLNTFSICCFNLDQFKPLSRRMQGEALAQEATARNRTKKSSQNRIIRKQTIVQQ